MHRLVFVLALTACKEPARDKSLPPAEPETIAAPGAPVAKGPDTPKQLQPEEGTLAIDKIVTGAGVSAAAVVKVTPGNGHHISTTYPSSLSLVAPAGVTLEKAKLTAGHDKPGDAEAFGESGLSFSVRATAAKPGSYEITGVFRFGVCQEENCHDKTQPITIAMAVN